MNRQMPRNGITTTMEFFLHRTPELYQTCTIGMPNNPFDSPLFGAIVCFISMLHHQNYEFHTNSRSHPLTHTLTQACTLIRMYAHTHTYVYTYPIFTMDGEFFDPFHVKYTTHSIAVSRHKNSHNHIIQSEYVL